MNGRGALLLIFGRETRRYFLQPLAWVVLTALWFLTGLSFWSATSLPTV